MAGPCVKTEMRKTLFGVRMHRFFETSLVIILCFAGTTYPQMIASSTDSSQWTSTMETSDSYTAVMIDSSTPEMMDSSTPEMTDSVTPVLTDSSTVSSIATMMMMDSSASVIIDSSTSVMIDSSTPVVMDSSTTSSTSLMMVSSTEDTTYRLTSEPSTTNNPPTQPDSTMSQTTIDSQLTTSSAANTDSSSTFSVTTVTTNSSTFSSTVSSASTLTTPNTTSAIETTDFETNTLTTLTMMDSTTETTGFVTNILTTPNTTSAIETTGFVTNTLTTLTMMDSTTETTGFVTNILTTPNTTSAMLDSTTETTGFVTNTLTTPNTTSATILPPTSSSISQARPPQCSVVQGSVTFNDSAVVDTCSQSPIQCSTNGVDTLLKVTNSSRGPVSWSIISGHVNVNSTLLFDVCVTENLYYSAGPYEAILNVSNSTGTTSVHFTVTIDDVNQPPMFLNLPIIISLPGNTTVHSTVAQINSTINQIDATTSSPDVIFVWDPDNRTVNYEFFNIQYVGGSVVFPNSTQMTVTSRSQLPISLDDARGPPYIFTTTSSLSSYSQIIFNILAVDHEGLEARCNITFAINDVNQAPECRSGVGTTRLALSTPVGTTVYIVPCMEGDVIPAWSSLSYSEQLTSDSDFTYFSVNGSGMVTLDKPVPTNVSTMTYKVDVTDGGGLSSNFTVTFNVSRTQTLSCTPASQINVTFQETDVAGTCTRQTVTCVDTSGRHLPLSFRVLSNDTPRGETMLTNSTTFDAVTNSDALRLEVCINRKFNSSLLTVGNSKIEVEVNNTVAVTMVTFAITVEDINQSPYFEQSTYSTSIAEELTTNATTLLAVIRSSGTTDFPNVLNIVHHDPDTNSNFTVRFYRPLELRAEYHNGSKFKGGFPSSWPITINGNNILVVDSMRPELLYYYTFAAIDYQNLSANATVIITVIDVNQPPICQPVSPIDLDLLETPQSVIYTLTCLDSDYNDTFRSLRYFSYPGSNSSLLNITETGEIILTSPLPRDTTVLTLYAYALDGGGLRSNVTLTFNVKLHFINDMSLTLQSKGKLEEVRAPVWNYTLIAGFTVTATCSARVQGFNNSFFSWTLGGRDVPAIGNLRYNVTMITTNSNDPHNFTSIFTFREIQLTETGSLVCRVTAGNDSQLMQVQLQVVGNLSAILTPPTKIVTSGNEVSFNCTRRAGYYLNWTAVLYNDSEDQSRQTEIMAVNKSEQENQTVFTIKDVTAERNYTCIITDKFASAVSDYVNVIIQSDIPGTQKCPKDDEWEETPVDNTVRLECPTGYAVGQFQSRRCKPDGYWSAVDTSECIRQDLQDLNSIVSQIGDGTTNFTSGEVLEKLVNSTNNTLLQGDVIITVDILDKLVDMASDQPQAPAKNELENYVQTAHNVLQAPREVWKSQMSSAFKLVHTVDKLGKAAARNQTSTSPTLVKTDQIVLQVARSNRTDIRFPIEELKEDYPDWVLKSGTSAFLPVKAIDESVGVLKYSVVIYKDLSNVLSGKLDSSFPKADELFINSPILALSVPALNSSDKIDPPLNLTFSHIFQENFSSPSCQFLEFTASQSKSLWSWSSRGCKTKVSSSNKTECECDHLTNFAILMSRYTPPPEVEKALGILSIVGCSISIFCLLVTLLIYFIFWRYVRSDRSVILVNLCVVLILAYVTFLAGVNRVEHQTACKIVAVLLHYLWLAVFCLMLAEGLDLFISIVLIFPIKSVLTWLLLMAYGVPLITVAISMGVTQLEGYGGSDSCWLSVKDGLLWAFVGPALCALLANFVFVALVIRALLSSTAMITKASRERAKAVLKAICIMTPVLGLTWIFGVMSVNEDTLAFQVLFIIFNSLQGLMIFLLHCLLSKQVQEGYQNKRRRYRASTSGYGTQRHTSDSSALSNDLDKQTISPFLQVDRQVQEIASKMAAYDNHNLMRLDDPPKMAALKNPVLSSSSFTGTDPFLNIHLTESTTDDLDIKDRDSLDDEEETQVKAQLSASPVTMTTSAMVESGQGDPGWRAVSKKRREEDIEQQAEKGKGLVDASRRRNPSNPAGKVTYTKNHTRNRQNSTRGPKSQSRRPYQKAKVGQSVPPAAKANAAPLAEIHTDLISSLLPAERSTRAGLPPRESRSKTPPLNGCRPQDRVPFEQSRPTSPRRLSTSAESLGLYYNPFTGTRDDHNDDSYRSPPPKVAPRPRRNNDPPVDYW